MRLIRSLISLVLLGGLIYLGATVNLGKRTFFGHIANIWRSDEAKELREDVGDKAGPVLDKARRGARAGWDEYTRDEPASARDGGGAGAGAARDGGAVPTSSRPARDGGVKAGGE